MAVFESQHNRIIDLNPSCPPPSLPLIPSFVDTYLSNRTPPPFRPTPLAPYTSFDILVHDNLPPPSTPESLLRYLSLFPPMSTLNTVSVNRIQDFSTYVTRLATRLNHSFKQKTVDFKPISYMLHSLQSLVPHAPEIVIAALSPRSDKRFVIDRVREWARSARSASHSSSSPPMAEQASNGMSWAACADSMCAALINVLLEVSPSTRASVGGYRVQLGTTGQGASDLKNSDGPDVRDVLAQVPEVTAAIARISLKECGEVGSAVEKLRNGWRPDVVVGKRGGGKRKRNTAQSVGQLQSFGAGDEADAEWIKRHVEHEDARERMEAQILEQGQLEREKEEERAESEKRATDIGNVGDVMVMGGGFDSVYDDDPDEGVLEGEVSLVGLRGADDDDDLSDQEIEDDRITMPASGRRGGGGGGRGGSFPSRGFEPRRGRGDRAPVKNFGRGGGAAVGSSSTTSPTIGNNDNSTGYNARFDSNANPGRGGRRPGPTESSGIAHGTGGGDGRVNGGDFAGRGGGGVGGRGAGSRGRGRGRGRGGGDRGRGQNRKSRAAKKQDRGM